MPSTSRQDERWQASRTIELNRVLIVESPRADELYEQRREGVLLGDLLRLLGITSTYRVCANRKQLIRSFREASTEQFDAVHIACHGCNDGLTLTTGSSVEWTELADMCGPHLRRKLLVLSACCSGARALSKAFSRTRRGPGVIVGTEQDIDWDDAAIAWQLLYRWLAMGTPIQTALKQVAKVLEVKLVYRRWVRTEYKQMRFAGVVRGLRRPGQRND